MTASVYAGNKILDALLRGQPFTAPKQLYMSLHTAEPGETGANEVSVQQWPSYRRSDLSAGTALSEAFLAPSGKQTRNAKQLAWPAHNGTAPVTVSHFALWDAPTSGNCIWTGPLAVSKTLGPTDECVVHAEQMTLTVL